MFQEPLQVLELLQRLDQFLEVFQPPRRLGRLVVLPHAGVAALVQDDARQFGMDQCLSAIRPQRSRSRTSWPSSDRALALDQPLVDRQPRALDQAHAIGAGDGLDGLLRLVAQPALGGVHDPLEGQIVVRADHERK